MTDTATMMALGEDYPELRESVRKICERYPGAYWRKLEAEQAYPTEFITELTQSGFLASLIPEEYGGSGLPLRAAAVILEQINASGCTASQGHAQMYIMGTVLRHGSEEQKRRYLPKIASGELRLQAFGVTEPTTGSDTTKLKTRAVRQGNHYVINGQKVWTSRARHSDLMLLLARTTPVDEVRRRTDGLSVFLVDLRIGYKFSDRAKLWLDVFNLFNNTGAHQIDYFYPSQLANEKAPVYDIHFKPVEPASVRLTFSMTF